MCGDPVKCKNCGACAEHCKCTNTGTKPKRPEPKKQKHIPMPKDHVGVWANVMFGTPLR